MAFGRNNDSADDDLKAERERERIEAKEKKLAEREAKAQPLCLGPFRGFNLIHLANLSEGCVDPAVNWRRWCQLPNWHLVMFAGCFNSGTSYPGGNCSE